ncbi:MAG: DNA polymerase III subunit gamma/tau [Candidatus Limiplasma sp.]|nr:DNA polymerase III subunit gamma/tau [Candidatus Limiplasma sp.]
MAYQALYRQWRPMTFAEVIGQEAVVSTLRRQIQTGRIAHAYLLCGCRGTGKTTIAKIMSRAVNCLQPLEGDPCGVCEPCRAILAESTLDVLELDAASNNSVDNVRDLLEQVRYPAQVGKYKVYIIDEVHMLSTAAFNALLKTLEEPPQHVVFILATTEPQKIPATILSRVQRYDFGRIPAAQIVGRMEDALRTLELQAEPEALQMVARAAEGAMRDAFSILDMCVSAAAEGVLTAAITRDVLGASDRDFLFAFADRLAAGDAAGVMKAIDSLMRAGREPMVFLKEMSRHVRALLMVRAVQEHAAGILEVTDEDERRYRQQAEAFTGERLLRILEGLTRTESEMRYASSPRVGLEVAMLRACAGQQGEDTAALQERIAELEGKLTALTQALDSGRLAAAAVTFKATTQQTLTPEVARPPAAKTTGAPPPTDEQQIWEAALTLIAKTEPPLLGLLKKERFIGCRDGVFRVQVAFERKDFSLVQLNKPTRQETVARALSEAAGKPLRFEAVLDGDGGASQGNDLREENVRTLASAVGRDLLQVDDGNSRQT